MGQNIAQGNKVPLVAQLECAPGAPTFYVEAELLKDDRTPLTTVQLTEEADGRFSNTSVVMPDLPFITATFVVYENAGLTIESEDYCRVTETYNLGANVDEISSKLDALLTKGQDLGLSGDVEADSMVDGNLDTSESELSGVTQTESEVSGIVEEIKTSGNINGNENLKGSL